MTTKKKRILHTRCMIPITSTSHRRGGEGHKHNSWQTPAESPSEKKKSLPNKPPRLRAALTEPPNRAYLMLRLENGQITKASNNENAHAPPPTPLPSSKCTRTHTKQKSTRYGGLTVRRGFPTRPYLPPSCANHSSPAAGRVGDGYLCPCAKHGRARPTAGATLQQRR